MKQFKIEITETLQHTIAINAETLEEALKKAREVYDNEGLDYADYIDTDFKENENAEQYETISDNYFK